jgi:uncharacterized protein (DUF2236 family)
MTRLPAPLQARLDTAARAYFEAPGMHVDFSSPSGAPALFAADSVTWRVMKNPVALVVGGIAAVILELAEPRVRTGVWEHTTFRRDPATRMRRTGYAAMTTVYAPAETARAMIAGVVRAHEQIEGRTPAGAPYRANDVELLNWVQATASFGFVEAYRNFVRPLSAEEVDQFYRESAASSGLYGATGSPCSAAEMSQLFEIMRPKLERSDIVTEFLSIVRTSPILPARALQRLMVRGAVEITPAWARELLGLQNEPRLTRSRGAALRLAGALSDRLVIETAPPAQACRRLRLSSDYLYR